MPVASKIISAFALGIFAASTMAAPKAAQDVASALRSMTLDPEGFVHIADDGVARSYTANNTIIDYAPLSNEQLKKMISQLPASVQADMEHLHQVYDGVDGYDITDKKQIFEPPAWLQPAPFEPTTQPQSRSEAQEAAATLLDKRQPVCLGQTCTNAAACQLSGCRFCTTFDRAIFRICFL